MGFQHIISTPAPTQHHEGHHKRHLITEDADHQGSESFINDDDFEFTPEYVKSHVGSLLQKMNAQQIEDFIVFLEEIGVKEAIDNDKIDVVPSNAIKAHINMVFDKLEAANETHVKRALHAMLHYLHGFEYTEFDKAPGNSESSYPEEASLEFARRYALDMIDKLLAQQGEEGIQTTLAEMTHLLKKFEHHFSTDPRHTKHEHYHHHGTLATVESVTALVNKIFEELENLKVQSEKDHELKILAQILESFKTHHGHQSKHLIREVLDEEGGHVPLESVKELALELVQTLGSHKQTKALVDLGNMLVVFEARESDTEPSVHFEGVPYEFEGSSHNVNAGPDAAKRLVDEVIDRYVVKKDETQLTTVLRSIVAYLLEAETLYSPEHHQQNDDDVDDSEEEAEHGAASDVPEEEILDKVNTIPSVPMLATIGNRHHGQAAPTHGGFGATPVGTGTGSGIHGRDVVGSHKTPHAPAHTIGHRGFKKRR